jgi:hypothetical protein
MHQFNRVILPKMKKYSLERYINPVRKPVKREGAENYLLYTLLSFAASVALTRLFLEITGYPQLGNSELHIAHVLWGGVLLFVASLLPLIFANRWVYVVGALCAGVGVGLFIDEVGKFITQSNDYFYPAAAPIIYAFFLITVLVYFQVRKPPKRDARSELYRALDSIEEVLDHDLDLGEKTKLKARLDFVRQEADHPDLTLLADALLAFIDSEAVYTTPMVPNFWLRWKNWLQDFETRWLPQRRLKIILAGGLLALGVVAFAEIIPYVLAAIGVGRFEMVVEDLLGASLVSSEASLLWFLTHLALQAAAGALLLISAILLLLDRELRGVQVGVVSLLLSLTTVNLLVFYFEQFSTIIPATIQFLLLMGIFHYRKRYLLAEQISKSDQETTKSNTPDSSITV